MRHDGVDGHDLELFVDAVVCVIVDFLLVNGLIDRSKTLSVECKEISQEVSDHN